MEEDQELKHFCKLCNKSFPCGRSLGGHMRSHVINGGTNASYVLRENPKKTCRFKDSSEDTLLLHDKLCKECGKGFQSWKALFGHMKCHSVRFSSSVEEEEEDSWSQSDNENGAPNRKKRSSRRTKRYMGNSATSSSISINANNNGSPSVCEIEQEEVAMCLMMLSRDMGHWGGGLNSVGESSDNYNSEFLEANNNVVITKIEGEIVKKFKKLRNGKLDPALLERQSEFGSKRSEILENEKSKNLIKGSGFDQDELGSRRYNQNPNKRKCIGLIDPELGMNQSRKLAYDPSNSREIDYEKKSKFECATCNKTFHSYQALGGHRASHKKLKGCFGSKIDGSENSIETTDQISSNPIIDHEMVEKVKTHECPICFRVFSSGQALGGHKRSHLINGGSEAKSNQSGIVIPKPVPGIRDFLDLNMPAPVEEESSFKPWWVGSNHKHETLLGLLSS